MSERDSGRINADNLLLHPSVKELESTLEKATKLETQLAEARANLEAGENAYQACEEECLAWNAKQRETQARLNKAISYLKRIERADSVVTALVITKDALVELEDKYG